jgi:hypothetical protein
MDFKELQQWMNSLFGRQRAWSYEEAEGLSRLLPISKEDRALLSWAYTLPRDSEGWPLIKGNRASKPKHSVLLLVREFGSEIDKWQSARQANGLNGSLSLRSSAKKIQFSKNLTSHPLYNWRIASHSRS